ncbi:aminotransferase class I/II-fold pyridoxal phosphate-dependent enzyme [Haloarculaceae archaeon H-GB2-1]|nr:aminotransferase class I/II-fold pyridoxal phosphate-dependent enzyme [Haloarculaceae archaeon H-GB1-1]MEA5406184.1 aminotransferase class I/II-fold pyridoxal phosphate-dependent enzyme [Haloarculaceae archaeon H-GB2-1]
MDPDAVDELASTGLPDDGAHEDAVMTDREAETDADVQSPGRVPHGSTDDPWLVDFSANVNPCVPDGVSQAYQSALAASRSYPSDTYEEFRVAAADYVGSDPRQVVPTPGGLAAIRLAIGATVEPDDSVLVPHPSFGEYAREVRLQGATAEFVAHDEVLATDPADHAMAIVCTPNNPTGEAADPDELAAYADRCAAADTVLLVDEAFLGFTDLPSLAGREGVVVARSLTKLFGLPGLRAGFAVASGDLRDRLDAARITWGLGTPAAAVGAHCLRDEAFIRATRERVASERERMRERLAAAYDVYDSDAPFLLFDVGSSERVDDLLGTAREDGVALRDARTFRGLDSHVRVAVRLPDANDLLLDVLEV